MKPIFRFYFTAILMILLASSCTGYKKIPYIKDAANLEQTELAKTALNYEAKVMPNDILLITVNTLTPEAAKDFNLPLIPQSSKNITPTDVTSVTELSIRTDVSTSRYSARQKWEGSQKHKWKN